jgi:hypothetical protein
MQGCREAVVRRSLLAFPQTLFGLGNVGMLASLAHFDPDVFAPPVYTLDLPAGQPLTLCHPQEGIEDLDDKNLLARKDFVQLAAEGFNFREFRH